MALIALSWADTSGATQFSSALDRQQACQGLHSHSPHNLVCRATESADTCCRLMVDWEKLGLVQPQWFGFLLSILNLSSQFISQFTHHNLLTVPFQDPCGMVRSPPLWSIVLSKKHTGFIRSTHLRIEHKVSFYLTSKSYHKFKFYSSHMLFWMYMPQFCHHQSGDLHFLNRNAKQKAKIDIQQMVGLTDLQRLDSQNTGDCRSMVD